jgi:tetratricopeptide (TPR) repeat protein
MPATDYMVVDPRHDHGFRIRRPDLSVTMDTPNACNKCHTDKSPDWAARQVETWYGHPPRGLQRFAPALHAARRQQPDAGPLLRALAADADQPVIARATALSSLAAYPDRRTLELIQQGLSGEDPLERLGALEALDGSGPARRMLAFPLLWDEARAVRIEAARLLAALPRDRLSEAHVTKLDQAIEEYLTVQRFNAERPEAQLNLGNVYAELGHYADAEQAYRKALRLQPRFIPVYVNLAQLLSNREREREGEGVLRRGLERNPDNAVLHHALGLSLVRQKQPVGALEYFAKAAKLAPDVPRYGYVHGVALQSAGKLERAIQVLEAAHRRHPGNGDILYALVTFNRDAGRGQEALRYAKKLSELAPNQPAIQQLVRELQGAGS